MGARAAVPGVRFRLRRRSTSTTVPELVGPTPPAGRRCWPGPTSRDRPGPTSGRRWSTAATSATCSACSTPRLALMLDEDDPLFANWDQDETAVAERYDAQDPAVVAAELAAAADHVAASFAAVEGDQWERVGRRSDGARFTRAARSPSYFVHDPVHHLWDVGGLSRRDHGPDRDRAGRTARAPDPSACQRVPVMPPASPNVSPSRSCELRHAAGRPARGSIRGNPVQSRRVTACRTSSGASDGRPTATSAAAAASDRRPMSGRWRRSAARAS